MGSNRGPDVCILSRIILEDRGLPLKEIETPLEQLSAVLDAFRGHKTLYFNGGGLHRYLAIQYSLATPGLNVRLRTSY